MRQAESDKQLTPRLLLCRSSQPLCLSTGLCRASADGWVTLLSHYYSRKSDTLNRGYSGYNSNHAVALLKQHLAAGVWPTSTAESGKGTDRPTLMTLCLGANDSCLPDAASAQQSVPLEQYRDNLAHMLRTLKGDDGKANPQLHLVLIGPPQVDDKHWGE